MCFSYQAIYQRKFSGKLPIYELLGSLTGIVVLAVVYVYYLYICKKKHVYWPLLFEHFVTKALQNSRAEQRDVLQRGERLEESAMEEAWKEPLI